MVQQPLPARRVRSATRAAWNVPSYEPREEGAIPRKLRNAATSVIVLRTMADDCAGSCPSAVSTVGIAAPAMPATTTESTMERAMMEQHGKRGEPRDGVLEESHDGGGDEHGDEVDLKPGQTLSDRERDARRRALIPAHSHHGLDPDARALELGLCHRGVANDPDRSPVEVDHREAREPVQVPGTLLRR